MEDPEIRRRKIKQERRKEKAERENQATSTATDGGAIGGAGGGGGGEGESAPPPAKKRKMKKKSVVCEDIIDGFAIRSFKTYDDLTRTVASESGECDDALNGGSQESGGARISGSGGGCGSGDNKVSSNESPSKESSGKPASTKSPKSKKKKLSTTNQENNSSVMQPDLSRCSSQSGEQANGGGNGCSSVGVGGTPPGSAVMLEVGGGGMPQQQSHQQTIHNTNTSHAHSLSQLQPQQQLPKPTAAVEPIAIAKPHVKKVRKENKEKEGRKNKSEERKDALDAITRKDSFAKDVSCFVDNLPPGSNRCLPPPPTHHHIPKSADLENSDLTKHNNRLSVPVIPTTNSTSTSTSIDHLLLPLPAPSAVPVSVTSSSTTAVGTQFSTSSQSLPPTHFPNHHHHPHLPHLQKLSSSSSSSTTSHSSHCRPTNLLPPSNSSLTASANAIITSNPYGNSITIKRELPDIEIIDVKPFPNGPISPSKRQVTEVVNGHHSQNNHRAHSLQQQPHRVASPPPPPPPPPQQHQSSQPSSYIPISQQQPINGQPAQQQVVAPISTPKEKFGQGRPGSQTLFTPYATTAITRVRSPLSGLGDPPSASSACSGSQQHNSSVNNTVIHHQPESPKEPLVPIGSPFSSSLSQPQHFQQANLKNNQIQNHLSHNPHSHHHHNHQHHHTVNNNRIKSSPQHQSCYSSSPAVVSSAYSTSTNVSPHTHSSNTSKSSSSSNSFHTTTNHQSPNHHYHPQTPHKPYSDHSVSPTPNSLGRIPTDNHYKKDHTFQETSSVAKNRTQPSGNSGSRNSNNLKESSNSHKDKAPSGNSAPPNQKSNAALAFGSIARLLDSPSNTSSSNNSQNQNPSSNSISSKSTPPNSVKKSSSSHSHHNPHHHIHHHQPNSPANHNNNLSSHSHTHHRHHPHSQHPHHLQQQQILQQQQLQYSGTNNSHSYSVTKSHSNVINNSSGNTSSTTHSHSLPPNHPGSSATLGSSLSSSTSTALSSVQSNTPTIQQQSSTLSNNHHHPHQAVSLATSASTQSCSSRSHSPRGHSPTRERDSYSSNVSSLSRSSATPVSGSQPSSHLQLPPNLSPQLQSSSYSKAASWLSTVPGLSPVPRPTPPPTTPSSLAACHPSGTVGVSLGGTLSLPPSTVSSPFGGYPGVPVSHHGLNSPHHPASVASNMFAPPILPLSSISSHAASQPPVFGPGSDPLFPGSTSSDIVRRDLESRLISGDRSVSGGPSPFLTRPSDLHPHHSLLPPLSGVGHMSQHNPGGPPTGPPHSHSALFNPNLFKDLPKLGIDSPFYRTSMGISYPGFNGMLPPPGLTTPFAPPTQLPAYTQKKTGKWNAMHVRIAWEIYQHQQKGGSSGDGTPGKSLGPSASSTSTSSSKLVPPHSSAMGTTGGMSTPPTSVSSSGPTAASITADLLRSSAANHAAFAASIGRPGEGPPFSSPMLSPHAPPPHASPRGTPYDPLFLNSAASHLGPPLPRYPGFGALGPSFGGLSGLGSSLLGRDLSTLVALSPGQDHWARFPRPPFPGTSSALPTNWPMQQQRQEQRDSKTPTESSSRRQKDNECERPSRHSDSRDGRGRDPSPFRDRSPVRPVRTPLENGDGDSRSSRSNDSHSNNSTSAVHSSHSKSSSGRSKEDVMSSNGDREKTPTPILSSYDRERLSDKSVPPLVSSHPSRMYPTSSPLTTPISSASAWDAFPGFFGAGPRMGLSLLQLSERERELARIPPSGPPGSLRPGLFANGPYGALPLGVLGAGGPLSMPPGSSAMTSSSKGSPVLSVGGPIPLLNAGGVPPPSSVSLSHSHSHIHSSQQQNGPNSPSAAGSSKAQNPSVDEKHNLVPPSHGSSSRSSKEESSHSSR